VLRYYLTLEVESTLRSASMGKTQSTMFNVLKTSTLPLKGLSATGTDRIVNNIN